MTRDNLSEDGSLDQETTRARAISRRRLIQMGGVSAVAGLAGCGGGDETTAPGDSGDGEDTITPADVTYSLAYGRARPTEVHFNVYNPTGSLTAGVNSPNQILWNRLMMYSNEAGEWSNQLLSNFSVDGTTVTLEFDERYSWANGDPIRAQDFLTQIRIGEYIDYTIWNLISEANAVDERTVELTLQQESNPGIVREQVNRRLYVKHEEYSQWLEDLNNADGQEEVDSIVAELTSEWEYAAAGSGTYPAVNGPYQVDNIGNQRILLVPNEHYPLETNIPEVEYRYLPGGDWQQAMIAGELDGQGNVGAPADVRDEFPDDYEYVDIPEFGVTALHMQHDHDLFGIREVRQALAYLADTGRVAQNSNPRVSELAATTHLSDGQTEAWMGDHLDAVTQYGPGSKPDQATAKMEEAGFTQSNGTWQDPDGNTYELNIQTPPWPAPLGVAQTIADQLSSFGIEASVQQLEASQWISNYDSGDFALRGGYFGGGPHPYFSFNAFQSTTYQVANIPMEVELPPVGEPDGSTSSFNVDQAVSDLSTATDEEQETELVRQLAWYTNQYVPILPLTNGFSPNYYNPTDYTFPDPEEDPRMYIMYTKDHMFKEEQQDNSDLSVVQARTD